MTTKLTGAEHTVWECTNGPDTAGARASVARYMAAHAEHVTLYTARDGSVGYSHRNPADACHIYAAPFVPV